MANFNDLTIGNFYLVVENEGEQIALLEPLMHTDNAVLLMHHDDYETSIWRKKNDSIFEIVDELSMDQLDNYDALFEEEDEEDDDVPKIKSKSTKTKRKQPKRAVKKAFELPVKEEAEENIYLDCTSELSEESYIE